MMNSLKSELKENVLNEDMSSHHARQLEASAKFNTAMRQAESRQHAIEILLDQCSQAFSADVAGVYDLQGDSLIYSASRGLEIRPPVRVPADNRSVLGRALNSESALKFIGPETHHSDCDFCGFLAGQGIQFLVVMPLRTSQRAVGVLFLALRNQIVFSQSDEQLLSAFSEAAGNTLHRFFVMDQLKHTVANRERELQLLYDLMAIAGETSEMDQLLKKSLTRILQAVNCEIGVIHFIDSANNKLKISASENFGEEFNTYLQISGTSEQLWARCFRDHKVVRMRDLPDRSSPEVPDPNRHFFFYLGVPIRIKGSTVGVLSLFGQSIHLISPMITQLVNSAADELGLAVESAHFRKHAEDAMILRERQRLAHNLHDSVSQSLYALVVSADVSGKLLRIKDIPGLRRELGDIGKLALQGLKEMRLLLYEFRPSSLESVGLSKALELRLNTVECRAGIDASLEVDGNVNLPPQVEQEIYHIAIEALNNSLKHSEATSIDVILRKGVENIQLEIRDNGCGFDPDTDINSGGLGLESMRNRAHVLGGDLFISSNLGQGTLIRLEAPFSRPDPPKE